MISAHLGLALAALLATGTTAMAAKVDVYDYVIVGSGSGDGSLATRVAAETPEHFWQFFVDHYKDFEAARRDPKYTYIQTDGSYYIGLDPPEGARPAGIYYPHGSTLGGSSQVNAMNFAWCPDNEGDYIANLTGDASWGHRHMRRHLTNVENCTCIPEGTPGHGFDGYLVNDQSNPSLLSEADTAE